MLCAHVAPDSRLVLLGDFQCNPGWSLDCVSVHREIALVLLEFAADMQLQPFTPPGARDSARHVQGCACVASEWHPQMDGRWLFPFTRCTRGWLAAGFMAMGVKTPPPVARGIRPIAADLPGRSVRSPVRCLRD